VFLVTRHMSPVTGARDTRAFTLLEVVVALGVFTVGMVAVIGLFSPVAKSVGDSADAEAATRVADLLAVKLQTLGIDAVAPLLKVSASSGHQLTLDDAKGNYNPATDTHLFFANREGTKIAPHDDLATWGIDPATRRASEREMYFEIALIRNETISPLPTEAAPDALLPVLAYTARVRWPSFVALAGGSGSTQVGANPTGVVTFDHSQKQVLFFSGAITR
jgi:type II secretory pathway pseudopilin PulG